MTDLVDPGLDQATPTVRLEPMVFMHARIAMVTATTSGTVVDVNPVAAELFGRARYELVQEPFSGYVSLMSGRPFDDCLRDASSSTEALSFGPCAIRRRNECEVVMELIVSSGCRLSGRDLLLVQLAPLAHDRYAR